MIKLKRIKLINYKRLLTGCGKKEVVIDFPDSFNLFMIKGQNGAGKSSLLSQLNLLPPINSDGYEFIEGEIGEKEVVFSFNNDVYKVRYICKPNGSSHKCEAEIGKYEKGKFVLLSQSATISETVNIIRELCGLDSKTLKLTSLSVEDRGIVSMTSSERREFIQSISSISDIKELVKTISEKYTYFKKAKESNELKISNLPSENSLLSDKVLLEKSISDCDKKINGVKTVVVMSAEELNSIRTRHSMLESDISDLNDVKDIMTSNNISASINEYNHQIEYQLAGSNVKIATLIKSVGDANLELSSIMQNKDVDLDAMKEELENSEYMKRKDCIHYETQSDKILAMTSYNNIRNLLDDISDTGITFRKAFDMSVNPSYEYDKILLKIADIQSEISNLRLIKEDNFVPADKILEPSPKCNDNTCPLRLEFEKLVDKLEIYNTTSTRLKEKSEELDTLLYSKESLVSHILAKDKVRQILTILNDDSVIRVLSILSPIFKSGQAFIDAMVNNLNYVYDAELEDIIYNTNIYEAYINKLSLYEKLASKYHIVDKLKETIKTGNEELEKENKIVDELKSKLINTNRLNMKFLGYSRTIIDTELENLMNELNKTTRIITLEEKKIKDNEELMSSIDGVIKEKQELQSKLDKVKFNLELLRMTQEELQDLIKKESEALMVRDTLTKHLPIKVLRHIVLNLKDTSNSLLDMTDIPYSIHDFKITPKEFTIKVQNESNHISSDISKMSDGERSMLSLVTSLALNLCMLPDYSVITLDEMDATLSAENKQKFIKLINQFSIMKSLQIFMISHNEYTEYSDNIGLLEVGVGSDFVIKSLN